MLHTWNQDGPVTLNFLDFQPANHNNLTQPGLTRRIKPTWPVLDVHSFREALPMFDVASPQWSGGNWCIQRSTEVGGQNSNDTLMDIGKSIDPSSSDRTNPVWLIDLFLLWQALGHNTAMAEHPIHENSKTGIQSEWPIRNPCHRVSQEEQDPYEENTVQGFEYGGWLAQVSFSLLITSSRIFFFFFFWTSRD